MKFHRSFLVLLIAAIGLIAPGAARAGTDSRLAAVKALLEPWNAPDRPGVAVSVMRNGQALASVTVGSADLEQSIPITRVSVFHAASLSKQVTAFAILLLEQDGKLSIDAPLARYVPEAAGLGNITLRHLLTHTSGLREQYTLLGAAGWRLEDLLTDQQALALILAQRANNAAPGAAYQYINSDYTLLAEVVRRVSGKAFGAFCRERVFTPLGMVHSRFQEDVGELVPGRVQSYRRNTGGYSRAILSYATTGATNLQTTAEDLSRWADNLQTGRVGGIQAVRRMEERGVLLDGTVNAYAMGQDLHRYRGWDAWMHGGRDAGFRSFLLRVPKAGLSVAVLANVADFDSARIASAIADIYLIGLPGDRPQPNVAPRRSSRAKLAGYVGTYELFPGVILTLGTDGKQLFLTPGENRKPVPLPALSPTVFQLDAKSGLTIEFPPSIPGKAPHLIYRVGLDGIIEAKRVNLAPFAPEAVKLPDFAGRYYSAELKAEYDLLVIDNRLVARSARREDIRLTAYQPDTFSSSEWFFQRLRFDRDADARILGFRLSGVYADDIRFERMDIRGEARFSHSPNK